MMIRVVYSALLVGVCSGAGLASVVQWLNWRLYKIDHDRRRKSLAIILASMFMQNSILVYRLIEAGTSEVSGTSILFVIALAGTTAGLGYKAGQFAQDLAIKEAVENGGGEALWLKNVERRLSAEELRNTTIEHYAAAQALKQAATDKLAQKESERQDRSEERADETEGHA